MEFRRVNPGPLERIYLALSVTKRYIFNTHLGPAASSYAGRTWVYARQPKQELAGDTDIDVTDSRKDVFLSHAFEDKEVHVLPLTRALDNCAISYWLDTVEIGWGDSIVTKLNEGLTASRYVLVLLSTPRHCMQRGGDTPTRT